MEFVRLKYANNKLINSNLIEHREIIQEYVKRGYFYSGFIPITFGPNGRITELDLVFRKPQIRKSIDKSLDKE